MKDGIKLNATIACLLFVILLFGLAVLNLLTPDRDFSENENRYLSGPPDFSAAGLWSGSYTAELDEYVTDQFFRRDAWVGFKALAELALGKGDSNGVYFAQDGYLIEAFDQIDEERYSRNLGYVAELAERIGHMEGVNVHTMLVPTASFILKDKLPDVAPELDQKELLGRAGGVLPGFVDVSQKLCAHADEYIYYRTDHHWTSLGAFYAYSEFLRAAGLPAHEKEDYDIKALSESFYGTTWSKASLYSTPPDRLEGWALKDAPPLEVDYGGESLSDSVYQTSYLDVKDKYSVYFGENQPAVRVKTRVRNSRRLLIIKDSYANTFAQLAVGDFEEITMLDPRYYRESYIDYIRDNAITDVLVLYNLKGFAGDTNIYFLTQ